MVILRAVVLDVSSEGVYDEPETPPYFDELLEVIVKSDADVIALLGTRGWRGRFDLAARIRAKGYSRVKYIALDDPRRDPRECLTVLTRIGRGVRRELSYETVWLFNRNGVRLRLQLAGRDRVWVYVVQLDAPGGSRRAEQEDSLWMHLSAHDRRDRVVVLGNIGGMRHLDDAGTPGQVWVIPRNWNALGHQMWPTEGVLQPAVGADLED